MVTKIIHSMTIKIIVPMSLLTNTQSKRHKHYCQSTFSFWFDNYLLFSFFIQNNERQKKDNL